MIELLTYSALAFLAGVLLNVMPCVLPVIPFKIQAVVRELKGDRRSRILAAMALLLGSLSFFMTLATTGDELKWRPFSPVALNETLLAHQPVLLEFTAEWCLNCEVLEKTTYRDHKVIHAAKKGGVVPYRIDMTDYNASHKALLEKYGGTALPFALLIAPDGNVKWRFTGMFSAMALIQAIRDVSKP